MSLVRAESFGDADLVAERTAGAWGLSLNRFNRGWSSSADHVLLDFAVLLTPATTNYMN